jgi:molecular chaperone GrpE (heat shock protein)
MSDDEKTERRGRPKVYLTPESKQKALREQVAEANRKLRKNQKDRLQLSNAVINNVIIELVDVADELSHLEEYNSEVLIEGIRIKVLATINNLRMILK